MEWISVKDRLPETNCQHGEWFKSDEVLTIDTQGNVVMDNYARRFDLKNGTGKLICSGFDTDDKDYPITHWMPLPEPPTKS